MRKTLLLALVLDICTSCVARQVAQPRAGDAQERGNQNENQDRGRGKLLRFFGGRASLVSPAGWVLLTVDGIESTATVVFQIKNPADEGTPDSANVKVDMLESFGGVAVAGNEIVARLKKEPGTAVASDTTDDGGVRVILTRAQGESAPYVIIDVLVGRANLGVWCRAAYPLLDTTTREWHEAMLREFKKLVGSVHLDNEVVFHGDTGLRIDEMRL